MRRNFKHESSYLKSVLTLGVALLPVMGQMTYASDLQATNQSSTAQQNEMTIKGVILDATGLPIIGASIVEEGTHRGTVSDYDGNFTLNVNPNSKILISYMGYKSQQLPASETMRVVMQEDSEQLEEVVVVGYGSQKRVNLTGAVSNIDVSDAIASRPITDASKALQGATPGLSVINNNGGLGKESSIRLRGSIGSLNATSNTSPLILVDNVEVPSMNVVNPDDIESISVLKDAASASIYGTRAAWGVILITTKKGTKDRRAQVSYSNNIAWNTPTKMVETANTVDQAGFMWDVLQRLGQDNITNIGFTVDGSSMAKLQEWNDKYGHMSQAELGEMQLGRDFEVRDGKTYFYRAFDPIGEFTRKWSPQQTHNLSVNGGSERTVYNLSLGYFDQTGVMKENSDEYQRYNINMNVSTKVRDWWTVRGNVMFSRDNNEQPYRYTSGQYDAWFYLTRWPAWYPYASYDGKEFRSAVTDIKNGNRETVNRTYARINLGTELTPVKNLSINFDYTFGYYNTYQKRNGGTVMAYNMFAANPIDRYEDIYGSTHNRVIQDSDYTLNNTFKAYATYSQTVKKNHSLKYMIGFDAEERENYGQYSERRGLISQGLPEIALATGDQFVNGSTYHNDFSAVGFFARVNYDYMQKYLLEVNARYDGSSKFPTGKKFGLFPSFSAGWRVSEESFMDWAKPAMTNFKLRGSWGTIGNQDVAANSFISTMRSGNSGWVVGGNNQLYLGSPSVISANLTWERVTTTDLGVDASFFNNNLGFSFDWYQRVTSDMHCQGQTLPSTFGDASPKINYGEITGKGFEFAVDYQYQFENGLGINARGSISRIREKITKYNNTVNSIYGNYEGKILGEIWGYETDRLFTEADFNADGSWGENTPSQALFETGAFKYGPGDVKYKDLDGDNKITYGKNTLEDHGDLKRIGNSLPNFEYGFTLGLSYQGFDFSTFFQGVGKRDYWGCSNVVIPGGGSSFADALFAHQTDYWTPENTDAFYPRPYNNAWVSNGQNFLRQTRYLLDMSYLRCKNVTLGYSLPRAWMKKIDFESARIYLSGENLFEFDNMDVPIDPETNEYKDGYGNSGWAFGRSYPLSRTVSFGVQVVF